MSKIEWTHRPGTKSEVWNMIRGCSLESAGCSNCYAMHFAHRFSKKPGSPFEGLTRNTNSGVKWTGEIRLMENMLTIPLKWREPRTCFVNSMTDLFHPDVPFDFIDKVFAVMAMCPHHTFIILTKRASRMAEYFQSPTRQWSVWQAQMMINTEAEEFSWPLKNVWLLVSAEDQKTYDERVYHLMRTPAVVRGVSIEPQIGPINMYSRFESNEYTNFWILNGGESGRKARPPHPDWFRTIRDQCAYAGIPYFFKQWGEWAPDSHVSFNGPFFIRSSKHYIIDIDGRGEYYKYCTTYDPDFKELDPPITKENNAWWMANTGKHESGNLLDGVQHLEFPA